MNAATMAPGTFVPTNFQGVSSWDGVSIDAKLAKTETIRLDRKNLPGIYFKLNLPHPL